MSHERDEPSIVSLVGEAFVLLTFFLAALYLC